MDLIYACVLAGPEEFEVCVGNDIFFLKACEVYK